MVRSRVIIFFTALLMLASSFPLLSGLEEDRIETRAEAMTGHITTNTVILSDTNFNDVVIDSGVTVTVKDGVKLGMAADSYLYVEGTLVFEGTTADPVEMGALGTGNTWSIFQINSTGTLHLENFTIKDQDRSHVAFYHTGQPSILKNGIIEGGHYGLYIWNDGGDVIENVTINDFTYHGLYVRGNTQMTYIRDITFYDVTRTALFFESSKACTVDGMTASYGQWGIYTFDCSGLYFNDLDLTGGMTTTGMVLINGLNDIHGMDIIVRSGNYGLSLNNPRGSSANFTNFRTTSSVLIPVYSYPSAHIDLLLEDCDLQSGGSSSMALPTTNGYKNITLINTTWTWSKPFAMTGNTTIDVFWYLDGMLVNHNRDPIDGTIELTNEQMYYIEEYDIANGRFGKIKVADRIFRNPARGPTIHFTHSIKFFYDGNPDDIFIYTNHRFDNYTYLRPVMNLRPTNTMPGEIVVDEDVGTLFPLDDYFSEPESIALEYTIMSGEHIDAYIANGMNEMKVINAEDNWFGESWVNVSATDGYNSTYANVTVTVEPVNDLPYLTEELPVIGIEEDSSGYFNFTGWFDDVEGDPISLSFLNGTGYAFDYNGTTMNLTIDPEENRNDQIMIKFIVSDGIGNVNMTMLVNITPVNDAPVATPEYHDGRPLEQYWQEVKIIERETLEDDMVPGSYYYQPYTNDSVKMFLVNNYFLDVTEDQPVQFHIDAYDIEWDDLTYVVNMEQLEYGSIVVETIMVEVLNETTNMTEMVEVIVPMNFTYIPDENTNDMDVFDITVSDGTDDITITIHVNMTPVNDPIRFNTPDGWNITVDMNLLSSIDIGEWISDIDGDEISIFTSSDHININGTVLELLYNYTFTGMSETVTITVSDGPTEVTAELLVVIDPVADDDDDDDDIIDDDDDDEPALGPVKVTGEEDKWVIEIEGDEVGPLWVVVEDEDGNRGSSPLSYGGGKYSGQIMNDDAEEGLKYWISDLEDGEPLADEYESTLPSLKEEEEKDFPIWIIVLIVIILILIVIAAAAFSLRGKDEDLYDEE